MSMMKLAVGAVVLSASLAVAATQFLHEPARKPPTVAVAKPAVAPSAANAFSNQPPERVARLFADPRGHFFADLHINGTIVRGMMDTGATVIALSAEDARKIGRTPRPDDRQAVFTTANGRVTGHMIRLPEVRLQGITLYDVEAAILPPGALSGTLIGMSFIKKARSFEAQGGVFTLRQ